MICLSEDHHDIITPRQFTPNKLVPTSRNLLPNVFKNMENNKVRNTSQLPSIPNFTNRKIQTNGNT